MHSFALNLVLKKPLSSTLLIKSNKHFGKLKKWAFKEDFNKKVIGFVVVTIWINCN